MSIKTLTPLILCALMGIIGCTDPIAPTYDFRSGFLVVDGRITDKPGYSYVSIDRNVEQFGDFNLLPQAGARITSEDDRGEVITWLPTDTAGYYIPPAGFAAEPGRSYSLRIEMPEGELIESPRQALPPKVPFRNLRYRFDQEAYFSENRDRFVPAFTFLVDVDDPAGEANFYQYRFRSWETVDVCITCRRSRYRDGQCREDPDTRRVNYWDYLCDVPCWAMNIGAGRSIYRDELSDGTTVTGIEAGRVDFARLGGLLFEVEQANISSRAYEYAEILDNLANNGGGLNAPLPAPLVGNLSDASEQGTDVLGFVSVESLSVDRVYFNRDTVNGQSLPNPYTVILEPVIPTPPTAPCVGGNRTSEEPAGWMQ